MTVRAALDAKCPCMVGHGMPDTDCGPTCPTAGCLHPCSTCIYGVANTSALMDLDTLAVTPKGARCLATMESREAIIEMGW